MSPRSFRVPKRSPWSWRMNFQLMVRMRKLVKNGSTTSSSSAFLWLPPAERDRVRDRVADGDGQDGRDEPVLQRADELGAVPAERLGVDADVAGELEALGEAALLERDREHRDHRDHEEDEQPQPARGEQQVRDGRAEATHQPLASADGAAEGSGHPWITTLNSSFHCRSSSSVRSLYGWVCASCSAVGWMVAAITFSCVSPLLVAFRRGRRGSVRGRCPTRQRPA